MFLANGMLMLERLLGELFKINWNKSLIGLAKFIFYRGLAAL